MHAATRRSPSSGRSVCPCIHDTFDPNSLAVASSTSGLRAVMSTWAPASANALAMPLPMPFEPPVTMAALPSRRSSMAADGTGWRPSTPAHRPACRTAARRRTHGAARPAMISLGRGTAYRREDPMSIQDRQHDLASVKELAERYRNWGKWGPDDQLGTVNYISPAKVVQAAGLVHKGKVFSLALPLDANGTMNGAYGRVNPVHVMLQDGRDIANGAQDHLPALRYTDDAVYLVLQCATQWDALAHIYHEGKMYNGYGTEAVTSQGANKNSITAVRDKMVTRGVLLDIARYKGKP